MARKPKTTRFYHVEVTHVQTVGVWAEDRQAAVQVVSAAIQLQPATVVAEQLEIRTVEVDPKLGVQETERG